jgi:hypothetical protein
MILRVSSLLGRLSSRLLARLAGVQNLLVGSTDSDLRNGQFEYCRVRSRHCNLIWVFF